MPIYTCPSVWNAVINSGCSVTPYEIDYNFYPLINFPKDEKTFFIYTNYFGLFEDNVEQLCGDNVNCIVDNAQAFFSKAKGSAAIYSPRKFFGIPDGGLLISNLSDNSELAQSYSYDSCMHLLKRVDLSSDEAYPDYRLNEDKIERLPIKRMSTLTHSILNSINYDMVKQKRIRNYRHLSNKLSSLNLHNIDLTKDSVPMVYPFFTTDQNLRRKLIANKVYVATYWNPDGRSVCMTSESATNLRDSLIPLPIDQRYSIEEMDTVVDILVDEID